MPFEADELDSAQSKRPISDYTNSEMKSADPDETVFKHAPAKMRQTRRHWVGVRKRVDTINRLAAGLMAGVQVLICGD
ncbi:hypothetical protein N7539_002230 [Penicillium diatomitis]|uniref:Uncharacterized protein n=1 Tax=Penicillium diatomitis TaxID=2819901 RepID=A0A9W9XIF0_9EURO|nr:uncharacterized protein N7539_002230 [Penicillium diatomitis]KAJ5493484.1 hypothetical protein N7539_002230 [Penicillium diatomitis]